MKSVKNLREDSVSVPQLVILGAVGLFSPIIRLLPKAVTEIAGNAGILSPLAAIPLLAVLFFIAISFAKARQEGEGLADIIIRILGNKIGKILCFLFLLWFIFYAAVNLRSSGERLLSTIYPGGSLWVFLPITLILAFMGAVGSIRSLANTSQIFLKLMLVVLLAVFIFTVPQVSKNNLLPISYLDLPQIFAGAVPLANVLSPMVYILFISFAVKRNEQTLKAPLSAMLLLLSVAFLIIFSIVGNFGADFTNNMQSPFFSMIRNIKVFNTVERFEAVVIALWVLTDFVFLSFILTVIKVLTKKIFGIEKTFFPLMLIAAAVFFTAMFMENNAFSFLFISEHLSPCINAAFTFGVLPAVWLIGKLRKKI